MSVVLTLGGGSAPARFAAPRELPDSATPDNRVLIPGRQPAPIAASTTSRIVLAASAPWSAMRASGFPEGTWIAVVRDGSTPALVGPGPLRSGAGQRGTGGSGCWPGARGGLMAPLRKPAGQRGHAKPGYNEDDAHRRPGQRGH